MGILDIFFPKFCVQCRKAGDYICTDCFAGISFTTEHICLVCNKYAIGGVTHPLCKKTYSIDGGMASVAYKGVVKKLVYQFKYRPYLSDLHDHITDLFYEGIIQHEQFNSILQTESILVPIPLHRSKQRERGYNHAELLSKNLGKRLGLPTKTLLKRKKKTQIQANLKREERLENMKDAFEIVNEQKMADVKQVILVDDIITTGATMLEAAKVLKKEGIEHVWGIALAHGK